MDDVLACATACTGNFTVPIGICTNTRARQPKHGGLSFVWYKSRAVSSPIQWMMYWPARLHVPEILPFRSEFARTRAPGNPSTAASLSFGINRGLSLRQYNG